MMAKGRIITLLISLLATGAYAQTDILVDARDGKQYKTVKIGDQIWMAQNLAYANELDHRLDPHKKERILSYGDSLALGDKYGFYYTCEAAQKSCPADWHLPTRYEYEKLLNSFSSKKEAYIELQPAGHSGFNALMVGWFYVYDNERFGEFKSMNHSTMFWTAPAGKRSSPAVVFNFLHKATILVQKNSHGVSVRCVKDWAR
ncbi:major paralogous domain-containing protein [Chryseolinea serpens]|uniref:Major paralogous domain-containing protein n=1 Tax=Chryseolinea serpens TaxID=947013 RepID=A0A1M5JFW4_9BACT|nr:FISUMP domain-containing protein [Chryseolinea serpens]SHG39285.1 major paralogous domain-containing protein [Chryseolinea serpens]